MLSAAANQRLLEVVKATKGKTEAEAGYCGSNAVQLLLKGSRFALEKHDLSEKVINFVNFGLDIFYNVKLK
ncbi:MAG: hypothetical protein ACK471_11220, partial [Dolichospermum sp.]